MPILDLMNIFLSHIQEIDIEIIKQIAELIPRTQIAYFSDMFNSIVEYYEAQKEIPSAQFINSRYPNMFILTNESLSKEVINILIYELNKEVTVTDSMMALQNKDLEQARAILEKDMAKAEFTETRIEDTCKLYDAMNELPEGLQIGVPEIDNAIKNFSYGTNNFIAAPQKSGKTTAALSITYDALLKGMNVVYLTLEVKPTDIFANLLARHAKEIGKTLNAQKVKKNLLDEEERKVLEEVQDSFIESLNLVGSHISVISNDNLPDMTQIYFKQLLENKYEEWNGKLDLVVIDHVNLFAYYKMRGVSDARERTNSWIKYTTDLAKGFHEKGFILISLMQINRQGTLQMKRGKNIGFDVLADANEAERSCHTCIVMYSNPEMLLAHEVRLYLIANRNGPPLTSDQEDNSIETFLDPSTYTLGHRKFKNAINLLNKELLKPLGEEYNNDSLFTLMGGK